MKTYHTSYDIAVVGTGHAGCEAALAAARMGFSVVCFSINIDNVALMPCNPSMGGPAKGHLISEISTLGGEIGKNTDVTAIQIRELNSSKGPAVRSLRVQSDKKSYQQRMKKVLQQQKGLDIKEAVIEDIIVEDGIIHGVVSETGIFYKCTCLIIAAGTYLASKNIIGAVSYESGPHNERTSHGISAALKRIGMEIDRYQTATPARISRRSVDLSCLKELKGEAREYAFSGKNPLKNKQQYSSYLAYTTDETIDIIKNNLHRSPLTIGNITNKGPRYCASIDRKVINFPEKQQHQIFIEPEGADTDEMYVQGVTTAMPEDVQYSILRSVKGLENVKIMRFGYAIEYDYVPSRQLQISLETKKIQNLFLAGQINGTSGYEEAAAQGFIAGVNAALKLQNKEPLILRRDEAYIGVLIDDLINKDNLEPYRLFTSRAEYRLLLRHDNVKARLLHIGNDLGLVSDEIYAKFQIQQHIFKQEIEKLAQHKVSPNKHVQKLLKDLGSGNLQKQVSLKEILQRPQISYADLEQFGYVTINDNRIAEQVEIYCKYEGYIKRQQQKAKQAQIFEQMLIPKTVDWSLVQGITKEAFEKLETFQPHSIGQIKRISGISPADINIIIEYIAQYSNTDKSEQTLKQRSEKRKLTNF